MNQATNQSGDFGRFSAGIKYEYAGSVWASVRFDKGTKSLRAGAVDAYDIILISMRWNNTIQRNSMLVYDRRTWQIKSFNRDYQTNDIQITAVEAPGKDLTNLLPYSPSSSAITEEDWPTGTEIG